MFLDSTPPEFEVMISRERFGITNITVAMEWTSVRNDVWYYVSTEPQQSPEGIFTGNPHIQLVALYNTLYNVTVIASSALCNTGIGRVVFNCSKCVILPIILYMLIV